MAVMRSDLWGVYRRLYRVNSSETVKTKNQNQNPKNKKLSMVSSLQQRRAVLSPTNTSYLQTPPSLPLTSTPGVNAKIHTHEKTKLLPQKCPSTLTQPPRRPLPQYHEPDP